MADNVIKLSAVLDALPQKTSLSGTEKIVISDAGANKYVTADDLKAPIAEQITSVKGDLTSLSSRLTNVEGNLVTKHLGTYTSYDAAHDAAAQQAVNARKYPVLAYGVQSATSMYVVQVIETTTKVVQYLWAGTNLYYRHITLNSAGTQVTATGNWNVHYLYSLDELKKTNQTKTTANGNRTYINALRENIKELGNFESESSALAKLADISVCGSKELVAAHLTYQNAYSLTMIQSIENDYCRQIIFNKCCVYHRAIYFTDGNRTATSSVEDWAFLTADRLAWDSENRKYLLSQFGHKFGAAITDSIPLATSSTDGLMSKAQVTALGAARGSIATHTAKIDKNTSNIATLQANVKELGNYASKEAALEAIAQPAISGDKNISIAHGTYNTELSFTLIQNVTNDFCRQVIFTDDKFYHRGIFFTSTERTATSLVEELAPLFPDRLKWDTDSNKYIPSQFGLEFNADYTDAIPLATTANDGLMSKTLVAKIAELESKLNQLLNS